jgi:diguanylate cyclase (GGDEF)-like protein/PAS domain S-box-containing protein
MKAEDEARGAGDVSSELCAYRSAATPCASLAGMTEGDATSVSPPRAVELLLRRWHAAPRTGPYVLPAFEELAIGSLGRLADSVALVRVDSSDAMTLFRAGNDFADWIEARSATVELTQRSTGRARAVFEAATEALDRHRPAHQVAHALANFVLCSDDLFALPLHNRWGPPLCLVHVYRSDTSCNLLETLFQASSEGVVALAFIRKRDREPSDFEILTVNNGAAALFRRLPAELVGRRLSETGISLGEPAVICRLRNVLATGENTRFELDEATGGEVVHLNVGAAPMGDFIALTLTNIDDVKRREASFRLLFKDNPLAMWLCDSTGRNIVAVNDAAIALYGYDRATFGAMQVCDVVSCCSCREPRTRTEVGEEASCFEQVARHTRADGSEIDVHVYGRVITFEGASANLLTIVDITEQRRAEARIDHMARHDPLTGLPNRFQLAESLDAELGRARRYGHDLGVLYLDLDRFKNVNDTLGHPFGDRLLCAVAERLCQVLRSTDIVARLGGDEFAIIQPELESPDAASQLAARIVDVLCAPFELDAHRVMIGVSIGIAIAPADGDTAHVLLRNADIALYRAKAAGRRTFLHFSPEMDARVLARSTLESTLQDACTREEFELYFQPIVDLESGAINGFEALLRWNHPARGILGPAEFVPLAEETGLIVSLGEWVLRRACAEAATWPVPLKVSVNISAVQFKVGNLPKTVMQAIGDSGLAPHRLELEITESTLLEESESVLAALQILRSLGVGISMDDFGTGYSCLTYLRAFPFTKIKIDKSFVSEIAEGEQSTAIIHAVTALGASLGASITAEGVETKDQLEWLRRQGCTEIQGFYFSPPVPASAIPGLLGHQFEASDPSDTNDGTDRAA